MWDVEQQLESTPVKSSQKPEKASGSDDEGDTNQLEWHEDHLSASVSLDGMYFWKNESDQSVFIGKTAALSALRMVFRILGLPKADLDCDQCCVQLSVMATFLPRDSTYLPIYNSPIPQSEIVS